MSKLVRWQLIIFVVIAVLGVVYVGATYVRLDKLAGLNSYTVHADFKDSGGIFTNAEVTYLGTPVGRVGSLELRPDGVRVNLDMDSGKPKVPASAVAVVANRSAIGEQYVDLRPVSVGAPFLSDGSVIAQTKVPVPVEDVVASAVSLTDSVPLGDLHTVVTELGKAFDGRGGDLRVLVDALGELSKSGNDNLSETVSLIRSSATVLGTQADQSDAVLDWSKNVGVVAAQLASSDPDVRRLLVSGRASASQLSALVERSGGDVTSVVHNLATDVNNVHSAFSGVSPAFALLSQLSSASYSTAPGDGTIHFGAVLETNNPPSCTVGYESTQAMIDQMKRKNPDFDVNYDDFPFNTGAHCGVAQGNPTDVRGARRAVFADPDTSQPWDGKAKKAPDTLDLNPIATQLSYLLGVTPR